MAGGEATHRWPQVRGWHGTELFGRYDFDLDFAPDETLWGGILPRPVNSDKPGLFEAIREQLGLKLEATKGPAETLAIDQVERPSEN